MKKKIKFSLYLMQQVNLTFITQDFQMKFKQVHQLAQLVCELQDQLLILNLQA